MTRAWGSTAIDGRLCGGLGCGSPAFCGNVPFADFRRARAPSPQDANGGHEICKLKKCALAVPAPAGGHALPAEWDSTDVSYHNEDNSTSASEPEEVLAARSRVLTGMTQKQADRRYIRDEAKAAVDGHSMEHANNEYKALHDLDYFLLRYGPADVGRYVKDSSTISKYYGTLALYN